MKVWVLFIIGLCFLSGGTRSYAALPLRHQIQAGDSSLSLQTQGLCHSFFTDSKRTLCLPWSSGIVNQSRIGIQGLLKANEDGLHILQRVLKKDLNPAFVDSLFRKNSFQDASGLIEARAQYERYGLSLIPIHEIGAYKINNPNLPELHYTEIKQSILQLTGTWIGPLGVFNDTYDGLLTPKVYGYERSTLHGDYDALEGALARSDELAPIKRERGADIDLATGLMSKNMYLPTLLLRMQSLSQLGQTARPSFF